MQGIHICSYNSTFVQTKVSLSITVICMYNVFACVTDLKTKSTRISWNFNLTYDLLFWLLDKKKNNLNGMPIQMFLNYNVLVRNVIWLSRN